MTGRLAGLPLSLLVVGLGTGQPSQSPDIATVEAVKAAAGYVSEYQRQLTSVVADEIYTQDVVAQPLDPWMPRGRRLRSEVFFMFAPADHDWMAIRDVLTVDGNTVPDRPDLRQALQMLPAVDVAARFKEFNSRYNIGRTYRNFNEPTLSLLVLDDHHRSRFAFNMKRNERAGRAAVVTLAFTEKASPTLIHDPRRGPVFSNGELVIEPVSGRIHRAMLTAKIDGGRLELTTTYSLDARLGMWVPSLFREQYEHGIRSTERSFDSGFDYESILCEARYANFRRFATSVRIK
jgi:hypothetical protein